MRSRRASSIAAATLSLLALALATGALSCSGQVSYVVLTLQTRLPTPIDGVTQVVVTAFKGSTKMKTLTWDHEPFKIDQVTPTQTLSVSFTDSVVGAVTFTVDARNAAGCIIGTGAASAAIKKGGRADATALLDAAYDCSHADGGAGDGGPDGGFPGCNPVTPACGPGATCQVDCTKRLAECTTGGSGAAGSACQRNSDCSPGTQCFDYTNTGCAVKVCLRFCDTVAECAQPGDGGVGPGSVCAGPVQCGTTVTAYHTCTFSCDPRRAAVSGGTTGCPTGLSCLVVGNMDQVDCACAEATRTKTEGQPCASAAECAPGLICNFMGGTQVCRAVCRCNAQGLSCTSAAGDCANGTHCSALTNNTIYGVCLP